MKGRESAMNANLPIRRQRRSAFTLIELLVVVAIIALLISILLPSLSRARAQARTTLCGTRIAQLTKAILMYADDYDEVPPFLALGHESMDKLLGETHGDMYPPEQDEDYWWSHEDWLIKDIYAYCYETDWETLDPDLTSPRTGTLYTYTNFEDLYRCPDFQRGPVGTATGGLYGQPKTQNVFNYTRTVLGRKLLSTALGDPGADDELSPGPIVKTSAVYSPAVMMMLLDEQWDFHCAGNYDGPGSLPDLSGFPSAAESVHAIVGDMVGDYHGIKARELEYTDVPECKSGSVGYYDGHVALARDPWAWRNCIEPSTWVDLLAWAVEDPQRAIKIFNLLVGGVFGQRGESITVEMLLVILTG